MKTLLALLISILFSANVFSQTSQKTDLILKINGEEMRGKVTRISDNDVSFIYTGETLEYNIRKSDILTIVHSSGRVETVNQPVLTSEEKRSDRGSVAVPPAEHHNKIAILPFAFLIDNQSGAAEVGYKAQQDTYTFLVKHAAGYTVLDPKTTNALLIKAGVTREKMMGFTMNEVCNILGVEYVIDGTVTQNKGYQTSSTSGNVNTSVKRDGDKDIKGVKTSGSTYSNAAQRYDVSVSLSIYNDSNANIYNQSHKAFLSSTDGSYASPLQYLLKRCPLYRK